MRFVVALLGCVASQAAFVMAQGPPGGAPPGTKFENITAKHFTNLGAKRVKITYGPMAVPSMMDPVTHGMKAFQDMNVPPPCRECLVTGYEPNLIYPNGTTANANTGMWMHHIGISNLNRTDAACEEWPDRWIAAGNERPPVDLTLNGTRKVGYYIRKTDQIFMATELMNENMDERTVYLTIEWEYMEGTPDGFDISIPVWLNYKGNCMNESTPINYNLSAFTVAMKTGWSPKFTGELFLMQGHVHDGNIRQDIFMDGKKVCTSTAHYGETADFVSHMEHDGQHDHGSDMHITHISSMSTCTNLGIVGPHQTLNLTSYYNMTMHPPMMNDEGTGQEPIMAMEFLHLARPRDEAIKDILAAPQPDLNKFIQAIQNQSP